MSESKYASDRKSIKFVLLKKAKYFSSHKFKYRLSIARIFNFLTGYTDLPEDLMTCQKKIRSSISFSMLTTRFVHYNKNRWDWTNFCYKLNEENNIPFSFYFFYNSSYGKLPLY